MWTPSVESNDSNERYNYARTFERTRVKSNRIIISKRFERSQSERVFYARTFGSNDWLTRTSFELFYPNDTVERVEHPLQ